MGKTTVKPGNSHAGEGGRMPSTTGNPSGGNRLAISSITLVLWHKKKDVQSGILFYSCTLTL